MSDEAEILKRAQADAWDRCASWMAHHGQARVPIDVIEDAIEFNPYRDNPYIYGVLADQCPGPHKMTQHRDARPPWCDTCRRHVDGSPVRNRI